MLHKCWNLESGINQNISFSFFSLNFNFTNIVFEEVASQMEFIHFNFSIHSFSFSSFLCLLLFESISDFLLSLRFFTSTAEHLLDEWLLLQKLFWNHALHLEFFFILWLLWLEGLSHFLFEMFSILFFITWSWQDEIRSKFFGLSFKYSLSIEGTFHADGLLEIFIQQLVYLTVVRLLLTFNHFLQVSNVELWENTDNQIVEKLCFYSIESVVDVRRLHWGQLMILVDSLLQLFSFCLLQEAETWFISDEAFDGSMCWVRLLQDLKYWVYVEASLDGVIISWNEIHVFAELSFNASNRISTFFEMSALLVEFVDFLPIWISTNFENVYVRHLLHQIWNIQLIEHNGVCPFCHFFIFDVANGQQKLRTRVQHRKLSFGLLMDTWVVSHLRLVHESVYNRDELLWFTQENLIFKTWPIYKFNQCVHHQRQHRKGTKVWKYVISNCVDDICESRYYLINEINRRDLLLISEILRVIYLALEEHLRWSITVLTEWIQEVQQVVHFFWFPIGPKFFVLLMQVILLVGKLIHFFEAAWISVIIHLWSIQALFFELFLRRFLNLVQEVLLACL